MKKFALISAFVAFILVLLLSSDSKPSLKEAHAQTSGGQVTGTIAPGTVPVTPVKPVIHGGLDPSGGAVRTAAIDAQGNAQIDIRSGATSITDANGMKVHGPVAEAGAALGGPVRSGGVDNSGNMRSLSVVPHGSAHGTPNVTIMGGRDGTNAEALLVDTSGRPITTGAAAEGAAVAGNPHLVAMSDGTNARALRAILPTSASSSSTYRAEVTNGWLGVEANAWSAAVTGAGGTSTALDTLGLGTCSAFGNSSGATTISVQFSQNNSTWYDATATTGVGGNSVVLAGAGNFAITFTSGARYVRLKSSASVTATATLSVKV